MCTMACAIGIRVRVDANVSMSLDLNGAGIVSHAPETLRPRVCRGAKPP